jgi:hypothetical protein
MAAAIDRSERASRSTGLAFATFLGGLEMVSISIENP